MFETSNSKRNNLILYAMLVPLLIFMLVVLVWPLLVIFANVLTQPWLFKIYSSTPLYREAFRESLRVSAISTALCLIIGLPLAFALHLLSLNTGKRKYYWAIYFILMLPLILSTNGTLAGKAAMALGGGPVLARLMTYTPIVILIMLMAFEKIDWTLLPVARCLGAGFWRIFFKLFLPLGCTAAVASACGVYSVSLGAVGAALEMAYDVPETFPTLIYTELFTPTTSIYIIDMLAVFLVLSTALALIISVLLIYFLNRKYARARG